MVRAIVLAMVCLIVPAGAWAQNYTAPDDRYKGYPKELQAWASAPATPQQLLDCVNSEYYVPSDDSIAKYASRVQIAGYRVSEYPECRFEHTAHTDPKKRARWVLRPAGTKYAVDKNGRDLFDAGAPGEPVVCMNSTPYGVEIKPPAAPEAIIIPPGTPIRDGIVTGVYIPAYVPPPAKPKVAAIVPPPSGGWFCSGKKGILCGLAAACIGGSIINQTLYCGFGGDDDEPDVQQAPPSRPPSGPTPPPNTTPTKPPGN